MKLIPALRQNPLQTQTVILDDGTRIDFTFYFRLSQIGWFIEKMVYGDLEYNGIRIVTSPNMLNQLRNVLPFGIACRTTDNNDPTQLKDFSSGYAKLYLLSQAETLEYAEYLSGQN